MDEFSIKDTSCYRCCKSKEFKAPIKDRGELQLCPCEWVGKLLEETVWNTVTDLLKQPKLLIEELERFFLRSNSVLPVSPWNRNFYWSGKAWLKCPKAERWHCDNLDFNSKRELLRVLVDEIIYESDSKITLKTIIPLHDNVQLYPVHMGSRGLVVKAI